MITKLPNPGGKAANAFLEKTQKSFNDRLVALQGKLKADAKDEKAREEFQSLYMGLQQRMQSEEQNVNNVLLDHILRTVKDYRAKNGLTAVIRSEAALDYDKSLDITEQILDELNKKNIEFKPVTTDQAKPADAGAQTAPESDAAAGKATDAQKPAEPQKKEEKDSKK